MKQKKPGRAIALGCLVTTTLAVHGQSADALIEKLIDKGILTTEEAAELRREADQPAATAPKKDTPWPAWVNRIELSGDLRARFDSMHSDHPDFTDRHRLRYRIRPALTATLTDNIEVGFRLTSGEQQGGFGGDPISGNSSFQDNASKKYIFIDLAYASWKLIDAPAWSGTLVVGKMENPFTFSQMVFDGDYTPEGLAQQLKFNLTENQSLALNLGQFMLDELSASSHDPFLLGAQLRLDSEWNDRLKSSLGISGLWITRPERLTETGAVTAQVQPVDAAGLPAGDPRTITLASASSAVPNINAGNTRQGGVLTEDFHPVIADAAVTYTLDDFWLYQAPFPIKLSAEFLHNPGADSRNQAYTVGVTFGKTGRRGLWEVGYHWRYTEADAWWEELVDSDFGGIRAGGSVRAGTNLKGHIIRAAYSPLNSFTLGLTYNLADRIHDVAAADDHSLGRLLVDAAWKF